MVFSPISSSWRSSEKTADSPHISGERLSGMANECPLPNTETHATPLFSNDKQNLRKRRQYVRTSIKGNHDRGHIMYFMQQINIKTSSSPLPRQSRLFSGNSHALFYALDMPGFIKIRIDFDKRFRTPRLKLYVKSFILLDKTIRTNYERTNNF